MERVLTKTAEAVYSTVPYALGSRSLHCHHQYEVYYFIEGDVSYYVEGRYYKPTPHSVLLMSPNVFHGVKMETEETYARYTLHFMGEAVPLEHRRLLLAPFLCGKENQSIFYEGADRFRLEDFFLQALECAHMSQETRSVAFEARVQSLLSQILYMSQTVNPTIKALSGPEPAGRMIEYLNDHLTEPVTLDDLASRFYISKHHMNKIFRQATGTTVIDLNYSRNSI